MESKAVERVSKTKEEACRTKLARVVRSGGVTTTGMQHLDGEKVAMLLEP